MKYDEIINECEAIQAEVETVIPDEVNSVIEHAKRMAVYMARTGYMLAEAKKAMRSKTTSEICHTIIKLAKEGGLTATAQNELIKNVAAEEWFLVDWADRLNRDCVHVIDLCRSIISKEKEEMKYLNFQK